MHKLLLATIALCTIVANSTYTMDKKNGLRNRSAWQNNDSEFPPLSSSQSLSSSSSSTTNQTQKNNAKAKKSEQKKTAANRLNMNTVLEALVKNVPQQKAFARIKSEQKQKMCDVVQEIEKTISQKEPSSDIELAQATESEQEIPVITIELKELVNKNDDADVEYGPQLPAPSAQEEPLPTTPIEISSSSSSSSSSPVLALAPTPERPIGWLTKSLHMRSDHMTFALALLNNKEGTKKEVGHQIDRAIEYVSEQLEAIAKLKKHDSIQSVEEIIEMQKPHINNLQKLLDLTLQNKIQALEKSLSLAWRTITSHNKLRVKRAVLVCKDDTDVLKKNKTIGSTILQLKYEKNDLDGEISDEEYNDLTGLFDKIAAEARK